MKLHLLVFSLFLLLPAWSWGQLSPASLWKARALEAQNNLEALQAKIEKHPWESKEAQFLKCQIMLEFAFVGHIAFEDIAHKKEDGFEVFHLVINGGEKAGLFDLVYVYTNGGKHTMTRVDTLPQGWFINILPQHPGMLGLRSPGGRCVFAFSISDPFQAMAVK